MIIKMKGSYVISTRTKLKVKADDIKRGDRVAVFDGLLGSDHLRV